MCTEISYETQGSDTMDFAWNLLESWLNSKIPNIANSGDSCLPNKEKIYQVINNNYTKVTK